MNFLLHRHLAAADLGSAVAGLGAMLPDLWRMADRRMRALRIAPAAADGPLEALLVGVRHHLEADRRFHRHRVFVEGHALTAARFRAARFRASKVLIFAHPAWELCLDGALVRRQGAAAILGELRGALSTVSGAPLRRVAELHGVAERLPEAGAREAFEDRMDRLWAELAHGDWIPGYGDAAGLAERLEGLRRRLGLAALSPGDHGRLKSCCAPLLRAAIARLPEALRELRVPRT